ncbi:MAG: hypothetical protein KAR20_25540, partial [Candidatus Heimdallarchaeota archaeon]|nr:hypothetical protein [Candidatus Heimdallarchaeota archaeon]
RLKRLKGYNRTIQIDVPLLDWKTEIEPLLRKKGVDTSLLKEPQRQLLRLPINLAVFLEIGEPGFLFQSRLSLHEKLFEKKQCTISKNRKLQWSLIQPLTILCNWMSEWQKLSAPVLTLDIFPNAVGILCSEGLIMSSRGQINFFHESFFDYIYARTFVSQERSLLDLLKSSEQHLFRRTQVRQILESLRQNDFPRYLTELSSILFSSDIRFHIKTVICQWMNSIDAPNEQEFEIISKFNNKKGKFQQFFFSAVLSSYAWFDLLNGKGWIQQQIDSGNKERAEMILWWLSNIAKERPSEIASLLRSWLGNTTERAEKLLNWFGFVRGSRPHDDLLQLCEDVINLHPKNLFQDRGRERILMLLHTWGKESPEGCGRILRSLF